MQWGIDKKVRCRFIILPSPNGRRMATKKVKTLTYHRNGVGGLGFYCAIVEDEGRDMLVVRFVSYDGKGENVVDESVGAIVCAAFDTKLLADGNITFGENSWRGDHYSDVMDAAIKQYQDAMFKTATAGQPAGS
jgi:hypothetical protein